LYPDMQFQLCPGVWEGICPGVVHCDAALVSEPTAAQPQAPGRRPRARILAHLRAEGRVV